MMITVITVVFNDYANIRRTIESVVNQSYESLEYIVIDGGSTDGTLEVIKEYSAKIDVLISEEDEGIFNAMNKGLERATGEWVNFMNSGDIFYENTVLANVFRDLTISDNITLIYGDKISGGEYVAALEPLSAMSRGGFFACHQSMFFRMPIRYNECFKVMSDYELILRLYSSNKDGFIYRPFVVCDYAEGGFTSVIRWRARLERYFCLARYLGVTAIMKSLALWWLNRKAR